MKEQTHRMSVAADLVQFGSLRAISFPWEVFCRGRVWGRQWAASLGCLSTLLLVTDGLSCHCPHSNKDQGETPGVWYVGANGSSPGTTGWVRKAGNLWGQWKEKRHHDLQAPGVAPDA